MGPGRQHPFLRTDRTAIAPRVDEVGYYMVRVAVPVGSMLDVHRYLLVIASLYQDLLDLLAESTYHASLAAAPLVTQWGSMAV